MSLHHENHAWRVEMSGMKKIVLLALAREANMKSLEASFVVQRLAHQCGMSESAVRKFAHDLELDGFIARVKVPGRGIHYRLTLETEVWPK